MTKLSYNVIAALQEHTLVTAESCTGGGIGAALTAIPGSSAVYKGGIISYSNELKIQLLGVNADTLNDKGAVSLEVAKQMAEGVRRSLRADYAVSVTGLAGPDGDSYGNPVGTVYIGFSNTNKCIARHYLFHGDREDIRNQAVSAALQMILSEI